MQILLTLTLLLVFIIVPYYIGKRASTNDEPVEYWFIGLLIILAFACILSLIWFIIWLLWSIAGVILT